jgi:hypothetical protein
MSCPEVGLLWLKPIIWLTCSSWITKTWLQAASASQIVMEDTFSPKYLMSLYNEMVAESGELPELMGVGAGAGGGFGHTNKLRTLNYREVMASLDCYL